MANEDHPGACLEASEGFFRIPFFEDGSLILFPSPPLGSNKDRKEERRRRRRRRGIERRRTG